MAIATNFISRPTSQDFVYTRRKKGIKTVPFGYYCYKWYPFFKMALFPCPSAVSLQYPWVTGAPK